MGVVSTPPLTPPASPERLMPTRDPSRPFLCGINGSTSAESFTSWAQREEESLRSHRSQADGTVAQLCDLISCWGLIKPEYFDLCMRLPESHEHSDWVSNHEVACCTSASALWSSKFSFTWWDDNLIHFTTVKWIQPLLKSKNQCKTQLDYFKY